MCYSKTNENILLWQRKAIIRYALHDRLNICFYLDAVHPVNWHKQAKIVIHSSSFKVLHNFINYGALVLAFSNIGCQHPKRVNSKKNILNFKIQKNDCTGAFSTLKKKKKLNFNFKWCWIAPNASIDDLKHLCFGTRYFVFPGTEQIDYDALVNLKAFDLHLMS
jgi:ribosomal protein L5